MDIPKDPAMLLSYVNTQLRDTYEDLDDFCSALDIEKDSIESSLKSINYEYSAEHNKFC